MQPFPVLNRNSQSFGFFWGSGPAYDAILFEIPWQLYRFYGDDAPAREAYKAMKRYIAFISDKVDAVFTPTDNIIMAAELAIAPNFIEAGIPHYTGADSFVRNGAFTTCGVNYTDLGTKTADLAYQAITEGLAELEEYYLMEGGIITVNTETAEELGIDYSVFADMGELVEVITTED